MMIPSRHGGAESDDGPKATTDTHFRMHTPRPPPHRNQRTEKRGAFETPQLKGGATCCCSHWSAFRGIVGATHPRELDSLHSRCKPVASCAQLAPLAEARSPRYYDLAPRGSDLPVLRRRLTDEAPEGVRLATRAWRRTASEESALRGARTHDLFCHGERAACGVSGGVFYRAPSWDSNSNSFFLPWSTWRGGARREAPAESGVECAFGVAELSALSHLARSKIA